MVWEMNDWLSRPVIGVGRTATIYDLAPEPKVLKYFNEGILPEEALYEAKIGRAIYAAGIPAPAVGEMVSINGRNGLIYERIDGPTLLAALMRRPWRNRHFARRLATLQAEIHSIKIEPESGIPKLKPAFKKLIERAEPLPDEMRQDLLTKLERMPDRDSVYHGDFHPENVILSPRGPIGIDWANALIGSPWADVARTSILLNGARLRLRSTIGRFAGWPAGFTSIYLQTYCQLNPGGEKAYRAWLPIVAAARLTEQDSWSGAVASGADPLTMPSLPLKFES